jgi:putative FmdB family regulatory protein
MPLYEYACQKCSHQFEALVRNGDLPACPACESTELQRRFSVFAAHTHESGSPARTAGPSPCGACGDPRGPGSCSIN